MDDRDGEGDVPHAFPPHALLRDFHAAPVADDAFVPDPFVLPAVTFPVAYRAEDFLAEQPILLRTERPVVDRLGLCHFTVRAGKDQIRRRQRDGDLRKVLLNDIFVCECHSVSLQVLRYSIFRSSPRPINSRTKTLKDSGTFGSGRLSPLTIDSYNFARP